MRSPTQKLTLLALFSAIAYVVMYFFRIPIMPAAPFLKLDPKDAVIVFGGFLLGPWAAVAVSAVVSFLEMVTVSESGIIGYAMNIFSSVAFAGTASLIYKYKRNFPGAVIGLLTGCAAVTGVMLLWNYALVPIYTPMPRAEVAAMLLPVFLPFNLIKSGINAAAALVLYAPVVNGFRLAVGRGKAS